MSLAHGSGYYYMLYREIPGSRRLPSIGREEEPGIRINMNKVGIHGMIRGSPQVSSSILPWFDR
jgi:hypothetical protein